MLRLFGGPKSGPPRYLRVCCCLLLMCSCVPSPAVLCVHRPLPSLLSSHAPSSSARRRRTQLIIPLPRALSGARHIVSSTSLCVVSLDRSVAFPVQSLQRTEFIRHMGSPLKKIRLAQDAAAMALKKIGTHSGSYRVAPSACSVTSMSFCCGAGSMRTRRWPALCSSTQTSFPTRVSAPGPVRL